MNNSNFNFVQIDELSGNDTDFKKEMIEIFLGQIPEFISNLKKYFEKNDFENLTKEAHKAKSSALIFGMIETGAQLSEIQNHAKKNEKEKIPHFINLVEKEFKTASDQLARILKNI